MASRPEIDLLLKHRKPRKIRATSPQTKGWNGNHLEMPGPWAGNGELLLSKPAVVPGGQEAFKSLAEVPGMRRAYMGGLIPVDRIPQSKVQEMLRDSLRDSIPFRFARKVSDPSDWIAFEPANPLTWKQKVELASLDDYDPDKRRDPGEFAGGDRLVLMQSSKWLALALSVVGPWDELRWSGRPRMLAVLLRRGRPIAAFNRINKDRFESTDPAAPPSPLEQAPWFSPVGDLSKHVRLDSLVSAMPERASRAIWEVDGVVGPGIYISGELHYERGVGFSVRAWQRGWRDQWLVSVGEEPKSMPLEEWTRAVMARTGGFHPRFHRASLRRLEAGRGMGDIEAQPIPWNDVISLLGKRTATVELDPLKTFGTAAVRHMIGDVWLSYGTTMPLREWIEAWEAATGSSASGCFAVSFEESKAGLSRWALRWGMPRPPLASSLDGSARTVLLALWGPVTRKGESLDAMGVSRLAARSGPGAIVELRVAVPTLLPGNRHPASISHVVWAEVSVDGSLWVHQQQPTEWTHTWFTRCEIRGGVEPWVSYVDRLRRTNGVRGEPSIYQWEIRLRVVPVQASSMARPWVESLPNELPKSTPWPGTMVKYNVRSGRDYVVAQVASRWCVFDVVRDLWVDGVAEGEEEALRVADRLEAAAVLTRRVKDANEAAEKAATGRRW